jgi:hypothetical protein
MIRLVIAVFVLVSTIYSVTIPIFEASDEVWHYPMVDYIADFRALPVQPLEPGQSSGPWRQEGSQPPLYYTLGAALTFWIDRSDLEQIRQLNPHVSAGEVTPDGSNLNLVVHQKNREQFPWKGTVLAVHIVRFLSLGLGAWAVFLTWALVRELFPKTEWIAWVSAAVHAFTPMYLFVSSTVNNDNLIIPLCTLSLLWMVRMIKASSDTTLASGRRMRRHAVLGGILGLAALTKATGIGLLPLAAGTIFWEAWQRPSHTSLKERAVFFAKSLMVTAVPLLAISGWWFYRNYRLYGDWLGLNAFYAVLGTRDVPASLAQLWQERFSFAAGYWGNFGGLTIPLPDWIYHTLNIAAMIATLGLVIQFAKWLFGSSVTAPKTLSRIIAQLWPFNWHNLTAARAMAWAWPAAVLVSWVRWATTTWSSQGRLIFSAIPMWSLGLTLGLSSWVPKRWKRHAKLVPLSLSVGLFVLTVASLPMWILPTYRPPALNREPEPAEYDMQPLDVSYSDALRLLGYEINTQEVQPGEPVEFRLLWQTISATAVPHSIFIHVLGQEERIVTQRDAYPGRGLMSTAQLEHGATWIENYAISIPVMAYTPDTLALRVGVYNTATGARLPTTDQGNTQSEVTFGSVAMPSQKTSIPNPLEIRFGHGIVLQGYELGGLSVERDGTLPVTLYWACESPVDDDYTVSVQLLDAQWRKAAQSDGWPQNGAAPTSSWKAGQRITEKRHLDIASDAVPNAYDLQIALYRINESGELIHLPIVWHKGQMPSQSVTLTRIRIK